MTTRLPSYIVAEIPEPVRGGIQALRDRFATPTARLPVEITLLGSSGAGPIPAGTSIQLIQQHLASLCALIPSWEATFSGIAIFPGTGIAYLAPADRRPFDRVHQALRGSSLPQSASPFPYNPHCTLRSGVATPLELSRVTAHPFPTAPFRIQLISVYAFDADAMHCHLICQDRLRACGNQA